MGARAILVLCLVACVAFARRAEAGDPYLEWYTVETPNFRIHYHSGLEWHAQRTANLAELVHARLTPEAGWVPRQPTHLVLSDDTDSANGFARIVPYNQVRLFVTAPDDMSALGDYDDWLTMLATHEYTHVLHIDNMHGLPVLVNAVLGKTYAPNQVQPKWIIEGWAVYLESKYTSAGRLRSTQFDMFLRANVLEHRFASLDRLSSSPLRWPGGTLWYLYGGKFVEWVSETYGEDTMAGVARDYGSNIIAWGINRSMRAATGMTYPELWGGFRQHLVERYEAQAAEVRRRGLREGQRVLSRGRSLQGPAFKPACARLGGGHELVFFKSDGHEPEGIYEVALDAGGRAAGAPRLVTRSSGSQASFDGECGLVFDSVAISRRRYGFNDLFRLRPGVRAPSGLGAARQRLTQGRRARTPDVSPDGRRIVYVTNRAGTSVLRMADLGVGGEIANERALVPSARSEQVFTPRFSPDGRSVAYGVWTRGGYRDIRIVDVESGRWHAIGHDRAVDQQPAWAPDGRTLYFTSDRTGIANVYAYELDGGRLSQVTNVLTGAYMPAPSPDGEWLAYVGYTSAGFDLRTLRVDRSRWLPALEPVEQRPPPLADAVEHRYPVRAYQPLGTLRPRSYTLQVGRGTFGTGVTLSASGEDASGNHAVSASLTLEENQGLSAIAADYAYQRLPFTYRAGVFRRAAPRQSFRIGDERPDFVEYATGVTSGVTVPLDSEYESQSASLSYTLMQYTGRLPLTSLDPWSLVNQDPHRGFFASLHLGYAYSNAQRFAYSISGERGISLSLGADVAAPEIGSESTLTALTGRFRGYLPLPLLDHHVLALALSGGTSTGTYPRRGLYYTGGFVSGPLFESFRSSVYESSFVLRGYEPGQFVGSQYTLGNAEYRFPIAYPERGVSTLPVFLRSVAGALFVDYGGAYDRLDLQRPWRDLQLALGAELWLDVVFGYVVGFDFRIGYARGTDSDAIRGGQLYAVLSSAF